MIPTSTAGQHPAGPLRARRLLLECARMGIPRLGDTRPGDAAVLRGAVVLGRDRRTHHESPLHRQMASALSARSGSESDQRQYPDCGGRHPRRRATAQVSVDLYRWPCCRRDHDRQSPLPSDTSRRRDGPNYDAGQRARGRPALEKAGLPPRLMIDCSHGNSGNDYRRQPDVAAEVAAQIAAGSPDSAASCSRAISSRDGRTSSAAATGCATGRA